MSGPHPLRRLKRLAGALALGLALGATTPAFAGKSCESTLPTVQELKKSAALATRTATALDAGGQKLYILGRIGQDLSEYGLTYSHLAFVLKDEDGEGWSVYHELNQCGTAVSGVYAEGLLEFYTDVYQHEGAIITLPAAVQERIATRLRSNPKQFHEPSYSVVAYSFATLHQNSNQWLLETMAAGMSSEIAISTRAQAQAWLNAAGFVPTELKMGAFTRLGGRMFKAQVYFDDHPSDLRWSDRIRTTTAESVFNFVQRAYPREYRMDKVELY